MYHCVNFDNRSEDITDVLGSLLTITMATTSLDTLYSQIDVFPTFTLPKPVPVPATVGSDNLQQLCGLMRELVSSQDRQTGLMEELLATITNSQRHRLIELGLWKLANPELAEFCKKAAKKLERIQNDLLASITEEIETNADVLFDSEFGLSEFVNRFGPKFLQLNSILQILSQLGNAPDLQIPTQEIPRGY